MNLDTPTAFWNHAHAQVTQQREAALARVAADSAAAITVFQRHFPGAPCALGPPGFVVGFVLTTPNGGQLTITPSTDNSGWDCTKPGHSIARHLAATATLADLWHLWQALQGV